MTVGKRKTKYRKAQPGARRAYEAARRLARRAKKDAIAADEDYKHARELAVADASARMLPWLGGTPPPHTHAVLLGIGATAAAGAAALAHRYAQQARDNARRARKAARNNRLEDAESAAAGAHTAARHARIQAGSAAEFRMALVEIRCAGAAAVPTVVEDDVAAQSESPPEAP